MVRTLRLSALLVLVIGLGLCLAMATRPIMADEAQEGTDPKENKDNKKVDKYLGIDWGDDKDKKDQKDEADDPDAKAPAQKVTLEDALEKVHLNRLERIKRDADKAAKMKAKADKAYNGLDKRLKRPDSIKLYDAAGKLYRKPILDVGRLAKLVKDEDTRLTLLREYQDAYKDAACEMFCKAAQTVIETARNFASLKQAGMYLKLARQINPKYPGIKEVVDSGRERAREMVTKVEEAKKQRTTGGGEKEEDDRYDDDRDDRDYKETGREDYKKIGR